MLVYEYTDTFGGEANYSWVRRGELQPDLKNKTALRRAKAAVGLSGVRGTTYNTGDMIEFRPYKMATVLFVYWEE